MEREESARVSGQTCLLEITFIYLYAANLFCWVRFDGKRNYCLDYVH